ncbi:MAG: hypothetical protein ACKVS9_18155 [Phycisphaerae bacterium]
MALFASVWTESAGAQRAKRIVVFAFDQLIDVLMRIEDLNGDGDTLDAGEVTRFIDDTIAPELGAENAQGLYALGRSSVLATDNFPPDNIVRLRDDNDDGDAFDAGEAAIFHDGNLPGPTTLTNPASLTRGPDGAFFVIDNNVLDNTRPQAVYRLEDIDQDGDVNDAGEVTNWFLLAPAGSNTAAVLEIEFGQGDALFAFDILTANRRIIRIAPDGSGAATFVSAAQLFALTSISMSTTLAEMTWDDDRGRMLLGAFLGQDIVIISLRDGNNSNTIDQANEVRIVWRESTSGFNTGSPRDLFYLPDGDLIWVDALSDRIWRLHDANDDGDYGDAGETGFIYDSVAAGAAGQINAPLMLSLSAVEVCVADVNEDGAIGLSDLSTLLANFGSSSGMTPTRGDLDGDGDVDLADLAKLLTDFGLDC